MTGGRMSQLITKCWSFGPPFSLSVLLLPVSIGRYDRSSGQEQENFGGRPGEGGRNCRDLATASHELLVTTYLPFFPASPPYATLTRRFRNTTYSQPSVSVQPCHASNQNRRPSGREGDYRGGTDTQTPPIPYQARSRYAGDPGQGHTSHSPVHAFRHLEPRLFPVS